MSGVNIFIYTVILCCSLSTSFGSYDRWNTRRSASNYAPQPQISQNADLYKHRSPVCLINQLAQKNNITASFELIDDAPPTQTPAGTGTTPKPHSYSYRLHLGTEAYRAAATTKVKAKDKVAREAYDKTKYPKPTLKERTCVENGTRTIVSILYEFAAVNASHIFDKDTQLEVSPPKFRIELTLKGLTAWGEGHSKKAAKKEAASKLVTMFGKELVLREITKKFNDAEHIEWRPVDRLNAILYARGESPAKFALTDEIGDGGGVTYLSQVETETSDAAGTGRSLDESRDDAASKILVSMGFTLKK